MKCLCTIVCSIFLYTYIRGDIVLMISYLIRGALYHFDEIITISEEDVRQLSMWLLFSDCNKGTNREIS